MLLFANLRNNWVCIYIENPQIAKIGCPGKSAHCHICARSAILENKFKSANLRICDLRHLFVDHDSLDYCIKFFQHFKKKNKNLEAGKTSLSVQILQDNNVTYPFLSYRILIILGVMVGG
jgi:hypothetical protein